MKEFIRFSLVGAVGFVVDVGVLYLALYVAGFGFYTGRLVSFLVAASTTWLLNRTFTFQTRSTNRSSREWLKFVLVNSFGGAVNYGLYAFLINLGAPFTIYPFLAVAVGSAAGLLFNFASSKYWVFRSARLTTDQI